MQVYPSPADIAPLGTPTPDLQVGLVQAMADLPHWLRAMGLPTPRPTLVLVGGASAMTDDQRQQLRDLFYGTLAPLAQSLGLVVVDGGTDAGVMQLMGQSRAAIAGTFPLVGVAPIGLVHLPDRPAPQADASPLEPNHSHCFLIPGDNWGAESPWIARLATHLSGPLPSITVLINGGSITLQDAQASIRVGRRVLVIAGTGRVADELAYILTAPSGQAHPEGKFPVADLIAQQEELFHVVAMTQDVSQCQQYLHRYFRARA